MKTILITGGSGFIGRNLALRLRDSHKVVSLSRHPYFTEGVEYIQGDVAKKEDINRVFESHSIDHIYHFASPTTHEEIVHQKNYSLAQSLSGTFNILEAFEVSEAQFLFYASSGKVYSGGENLSEASPAKPTSILGQNKLLNEGLIRFFSLESKKNFAIGRIFNAFGPGQKHSFVIPTIINQLKKSTLVLLGSLHDKRDYIYIDDVIEGILLTSQLTGLNTVNIGSGLSLSVADILSELENILKLKIEVKINPGQLRTGESKIEQCSTTTLKSYGWYPRFSLREGLVNCLKYEGL